MTILDPFQHLNSVNFGPPLILAGTATLITDIGPQTSPCGTLPNACGGTITTCPGDYLFEVTVTGLNLLDCRQGDFWTQSQQGESLIDGSVVPAGIWVHWGGEDSPETDPPCYFTAFCWYPFMGGVAYNTTTKWGRYTSQLILPQFVKFPWLHDAYMREPPTLSVATIAQSGSVIVVTPTETGHQVENGRFVELTGTVNYDGRWTAANVTATDFELDATYVADESGGKFQQVYSL